MYDFRDPTDNTTSSTPLLAEALSIDGEYIENQVTGYRTLSVSGRESLEYDVTDQDRPLGIDGMEYYGKRQPSRTITVEFFLQADTAADFMVRYRALKSFCKGDNRELRFADEPNAHYVGTLVSMDEPDSGMLSVVGTMEFYCADPHLIADEITEVTAVLENGVLTAHVNNEGSAVVYPVYRINHISENGYLGIVHSDGVFEMGNREEVDAVPYTRSEQLLSGFSQFAQYTGANPQNALISLNGSLTLNNGWLNASNTGSGAYWHAGCYRATLPADSNGEVGAKNFYCWWKTQFAAGLMGQTGFQQVLLSDENDQFIGGFGIIKSDAVGNAANVIAWDPQHGEFKNMPLSPSAYDENPFMDRGYEDILKQGSMLRFYYNGNYYTTNVPSIENKKVTHIYIVIGQWASSAKYMTINRIGRFSVIKNNVEKLKDIPNRYPDESEIVIDTESDSITVNGLPRNDEIVDGSSFGILPVGETDIEFYTSSWCETSPEVTVEYRKRWI